LARGLKPLEELIGDLGHTLQIADNHDVVDVYRNENAIRLVPEFTAEEKARGRNRGLKPEFIDDKIIDLLEIFSVSLLDAIKGFIQLDQGSASAMRVGPIGRRM
jgi:hypothetical protein